MKSFRRVGMLTLCCLLPLRVLNAQGTSLGLRLGYAHDLKDGELPGSWGGAFMMTRVYSHREWGLEVGYSSLGTSDATVIQGPGFSGSGTHSQWVFQLGPTLAVPLGTSRLHPTLHLGLELYRVNLTSDTTIIDTGSGLPIARYGLASRRDGLGPSVGATIYPLGSRDHTALSLTLRIDAPLTHQVGDPCQANPACTSGPSGWVLYPYLSVGAGVRWHVRGS